MERLRGLGRRRAVPAEVGVLALLLLVAALFCVLAAAFPMSPGAPVRLALLLAPTGAALGGALVLAGRRTPAWALHGAVVYVTLASSLLMSQATTSGGVMTHAWAFAWMAVYVAVFFPVRAVRAHVALMTACMAAAFALAGVPGTLAPFAMMTVTLWAAALALGSVSERLRLQADVDHLTGLLNRHGFAKAARRERALASRLGSPLAVALIDLDGFKSVNDAHGHAAGDRLLRELSEAWRRALRPGDLLGRFGGDEFVVLFPATAEDGACAALVRMRAANGAGWSAGVAAWRPGEPLEQALARADARLYEQKAARRRAGGAPSRVFAR